MYVEVELRTAETIDELDFVVVYAVGCIDVVEVFKVTISDEELEIFKEELEIKVLDLVEAL